MNSPITPPKRLHKIILHNNNKVLILKRSNLNAYYPDYWGFPTATTDDFEYEPTIDEITTAIMENYNISITNVKKNIGADIRLPDGNAEQIVLYDADTEENTVKLDPKHTEYKWVSVEDLAHYHVLPSIEQYLKVTHQ